jgi:hypothetical protein
MDDLNIIKRNSNNTDLDDVLKQLKFKALQRLAYENETAKPAVMQHKSKLSTIQTQKRPKSCLTIRWGIHGAAEHELKAMLNNLSRYIPNNEHKRSYKRLIQVLLTRKSNSSGTILIAVHESLQQISKDGAAQYIDEMLALCLELSALLVLNGYYEHAMHYIGKIYAYRRSLDHFMLSRMYLILGSINYSEGHFEAAINQLNSTSLDDTMRNDVIKALVCCYIMNGNYRLAIRTWRYSGSFYDRWVSIKDIIGVLIESLSSTSFSWLLGIISFVCLFYSFKLFSTSRIRVMPPEKPQMKQPFIIPYTPLSEPRILEDDDDTDDLVASGYVPYQRFEPLMQKTKGKSSMEAISDKKLQDHGIYGQMIQLQPSLQATVFDQYKPLRDYYQEHNE